MLFLILYFLVFPIWLFLSLCSLANFLLLFYTKNLLFFDFYNFLIYTVQKKFRFHDNQYGIPHNFQKSSFYVFHIIFLQIIKNSIFKFLKF